MIMKANTKKKGSPYKKLVPAAGSLAISAVMLSTSTYAWFTMSREVEVQNIQLVATTPEDIQISLGAIGSSAEGTSLAQSTGYLTVSEGAVAAPATNYDWSNIADISHYYSFGKLIPASSDTGASIFFTPDANGVGKTLKTGAKYYTAVAGTTKTAESAVGGTGTNTLNATSHVNVASDTWAAGTTAGTDYTKSIAWNTTKDDGYYIDIPVWFRTSSVDGAQLSVEAAVYDNTTTPTYGTNNVATADSKELYKAVRVAVLNADGSVATTNNTIPVKDGGADATSGTYTGTSILDWYNRTGQTGAISAVASQGATTATYSAVTAMTAGTAVIDLTAAANKGTGTEYGAGKQYIIRVWLEGEDPDCYNETAGQDWSISLRFNNETTNPTSGSGG
jgi:hypothetical protein